MHKSIPIKEQPENVIPNFDDIEDESDYSDYDYSDEDDYYMENDNLKSSNNNANRQGEATKVSSYQPTDKLSRRSEKPFKMSN